MIIVIGGGASGLMAAITAARLGKRVIIAEKGERVGRKLAATGNGRCNLTNLDQSPARFHGDDPRPYLDAFGPEDAIAFFESIGVYSKTEEEGRVYPYSDQATSVLDTLRAQCAHLGVEEMTGCPVTCIEAVGQGFCVTAGGRQLWADAVIVACGGQAAPHLGGTDDGGRILADFGHSLAPAYPVIVQLKTNTEPIRALTGIKFTGGVCARRGGKLLRAERGEVLFTEYGLSGPPVLQLSLEVCAALSQGLGPVTLSLDFMADHSPAQVGRLLEARRAVLGHTTLEHFFTGLLNKRVGQAVVKQTGLALGRSAASLAEGELASLARQVKNFELECGGHMPWKNAQATAGGARLDQFDELLQSRLQRGLYACGECLNVHGDCGGFNLQWAWSSGYCAGRGAAGRSLGGGC